MAGELLTCAASAGGNAAASCPISTPSAHFLAAGDPGTSGGLDRTGCLAGPPGEAGARALPSPRAPRAEACGVRGGDGGRRAAGEGLRGAAPAGGDGGRRPGRLANSPGAGDEGGVTCFFSLLKMSFRCSRRVRSSSRSRARSKAADRWTERTEIASAASGGPALKAAPSSHWSFSSETTVPSSAEASPPDVLAGDLPPRGLPCTGRGGTVAAGAAVAVGVVAAAGWPSGAAAANLDGHTPPAASEVGLGSVEDSDKIQECSGWG
mmetsp:Transcript_117744/g.327942  ORF Transcript_117744/g.327942 Transcript_117744/m.327942 type:complete len:265 (+) Transcript_117744:445-1239(+)